VEAGLLIPVKSIGDDILKRECRRGIGVVKRVGRGPRTTESGQFQWSKPHKHITRSSTISNWIRLGASPT
jgi:hypothetical protein